MAQVSSLVDARWLEAHIAEVRVVDSRWYLDGRSGRTAYESGHIDGAVWIDLDTELSAPATAIDGRHPLPVPDAFAQVMGRLGIADDTVVIVYDDASGSIAARLWWMLHVLDHPAAVLDGGLDAWTQPLSVDDVVPRPARFTPRAWPTERFADAERVSGRRDAVLLDARTAARFAHGDPNIDPRPGHIPGARSAPWTHNIDRATGRMHEPSALRAHYRALGVSDGAEVITYCGSGVTACHDLLALDRAGFATRTALFAGSWSQWAADPERPVETGE